MKQASMDFLFSIFMAAGLLCLQFFAVQADELESGFVSPPDTARPWVYWFFMDGNLSREGITADLEAMKAAGIGGVLIMEVDVGVPPGPVAFMSDEWCELFKHAVEEAERLGLEITLNAGPGWTGSGGPWVKAEQSMQHLVASTTEVEGPAVFDAVLPVPEPRKPYFGENTLTPETARMREAFYEDEVVMAIPRTDGALISNIDEKALYYREPYTSKPGVPPWLSAPAEYPEFPGNAIVPASKIIFLTDLLHPDGRLQWQVPEGSWTILRMGRRTTGANTRPAPHPGLGFECNKFEQPALEAHFDEYVGKLLRTIGPRPTDRTTGWTMLHIDSWEMGSQNWTAGFRTTFSNRRGYDPIHYLPVMTGRVVDSLEVSERFLWDLRQTAQELVIENHAEHLKALGKEHGFKLSIEPYDMNPTADMVLGGVADVPMCEFWSQGFDSAFTCIESTSIAHTLGKSIVAAEAFTAAPGEDWQLYPSVMKNQGDWALCTGINRIVFHRYAHQPWLDRLPGMTMGPYGVHWERTQTWWPMVDAYHRYLARCQFLLRPGRTVADICYLTPEGAPHVFRPPKSALEGDLPDRRGYNFDGCPPGTLLTAAVNDGAFVLPSGATYRILVLPAFDTMTPALLSKIKELVEAGATVVGSPPRKSPSLSGYPACDEQVLAMASELWGSLQTPEQVEERRTGKGRILWGGNLTLPDMDKPAPSPIVHARWIWHSEDPSPEPPCKRYFRRIFTVDTNKVIKAARILATADNELLVYLNGSLVLKGDNFNVVYEEEVHSRLKAGENILAMRVVNGDDKPNPAGLIAMLDIEYEDGNRTEIATNELWQAATDVGMNWRTEADGTGWTAARDLGAYDMSPWNLNPVSNAVPELYPPYNATADVLQNMSVMPDFESSGEVRYTHRTMPDGELYFVASRSETAETATCIFRVGGKQPELWDPNTGRITLLPEFREIDGRTSVPMRFEPFQSFFVVFRKPSYGTVGNGGTSPNFPYLTKLMDIEGPWTVRFDTALGGLEQVAFQTLQDWRERPEPEIQHYSGIATYSKTVELPDSVSTVNGPLLLDVGDITGMARIRVNNKDVGAVWCAPWQVDISDAVQPGSNLLEIDVANLWPNRLIGDKALPERKRITWTTYNPYKADSPLFESGLLGPVRLLQQITFPLVDYHVHLKGGLTLEEAKAWALGHGMRYGIAQNCGVNFPVTDDAGLYAYIETMKNKNIYVGMQAEGREWVELFSPEAIAQFDYVFTDAMTWRNDDGHRMRLWMKDEVIIGEPESFMNMLVDRTVWILENEPIDIYVNPTYLPAEIAGRYDELWTEERIDRVITAAVNNDVAIEISAGLELPKPNFIKRAKAAGAKFSFGTNNSGNRDLGSLDYCRTMITECGLTPEDMFVPKPDGQKAIQRKPLPERKY